MYKHYTVELRRGTMPNLETIRSTKATDVDGAIGLIEGFRDIAVSRNDVTWQDDEVNPEGFVYGLAPGGEVWQIMCVPPLAQELG